MTPENLEKDDSKIITHNIDKECNCPDCSGKKSPYIQIFDVDSFLENLDDWD